MNAETIWFNSSIGLVLFTITYILLCLFASDISWFLFKCGSLCVMASYGSVAMRKLGKKPLGPNMESFKRLSALDEADYIYLGLLMLFVSSPSLMLMLPVSIYAFVNVLPRIDDSTHPKVPNMKQAVRQFGPQLAEAMAECELTNGYVLVLYALWYFGSSFLLAFLYYQFLQLRYKKSAPMKGVVTRHRQRVDGWVESAPFLKVPWGMLKSFLTR